jgi:hypothetical protein
MQAARRRKQHTSASCGQAAANGRQLQQPRGRTRAMENRLEHDFDSAAEAFWKMFLLDEAFEKALYQHLRLEVVHKTLTYEGEGTNLLVRREMHLNPERDIPVALAKLLRGATLVKERGEFDAAAGHFDIDVELPVIGRFVNFTGRYTWTPTGENAFRRTWEGKCRARVPLVGRQVERYLLNEVEASLTKAYQFTQSWLSQRHRQSHGNEQDR